MSNPKQKENESCMCQNDSCRKAFAKPLKAFDLQAGSGEVYEACPHCLSKTLTPDKKAVVLLGEDKSQSSETKVCCSHYLGYLCERPEKDQIPDECIVCKDIVSCMLKSLKR